MAVAVVVMHVIKGVLHPVRDHVRAIVLDKIVTKCQYTKYVQIPPSKASCRYD